MPNETRSPDILPSILKNLAPFLASASSAGLIAAFSAVVLGSGYALPTRADAPGGAEAVTSQETGVSETVAGEVSTAEQIHHETLNESEEFLLNRTLKQLKANNLAAAIKDLEKLKDAFPENDDYLLLYRTALRKKNSSDADSQKWWTYERSLDRKDQKGEAKQPALSAAKASLSAPGPGRINQLKHATWLVLTTGKHKSPNDGRRLQRAVSQD